MRKDVREFIRRLEAVGLTVEPTPGHYRVLREGKPLRKANGMPFTLPFSPDTIRWRRAAIVELRKLDVLATGTWTATGLLDYQSYGCGEVFGQLIPPNFCGGAVKMSVTLTPRGTSLHLPGILTVFCVIGPHPPRSVLGPLTEGVTLKVPGIQNFNHSAGGDNRYEQTS
jgi:hypothetical protein